jgi:hypothetical protein
MTYPAQALINEIARVIRSASPDSTSPLAGLYLYLTPAEVLKTLAAAKPAGEAAAYDDIAKKLAAKPTPAPAEKTFAANSFVFNGPLTAKAAEFSRGLHSRTRGLTGHIEQVLASVNGLDCKNTVVRLQAEADATKVVATAFKNFGFSTVNVQRVYFSGGDFYAEVVVPAGVGRDEYCMAVRELAGRKLRFVPSKAGSVTVNIGPFDFTPDAADAAALAALKPYGTSRA